MTVRKPEAAGDEKKLDAAGSRLRTWRESKGMKLADADRAIGKSHGTWSQMESGKLLPPEQALCLQIDKRLGVTEGATWAELAPIRLERLDPALLAWHGREREAARSPDYTVDEVALIRAVRAMPNARGTPPDAESLWAERLRVLLETVAGPFSEWQRELPLDPDGPTAPNPVERLMLLIDCLISAHPHVRERHRMLIEAARAVENAYLAWGWKVQQLGKDAINAFEEALALGAQVKGPIPANVLEGLENARRSVAALNALTALPQPGVVARPAASNDEDP